MTTIKINAITYGAVGDTEFHYGHKCIVGENRELIAEVSAELAEIEIQHGRAHLVEGGKAPGSIDDMKAGELIKYAEENGLDIGDIKAQAGKPAVLAAVKAALAKKPE